MLQAGFPAERLEDVGFNARELKEGGYLPEELTQVSFDAKQATAQKQSNTAPYPPSLSRSAPRELSCVKNLPKY